MTGRTTARSSASLSSALAVLRCFSTSETLLGVVDVADRVGMHKGSVSRLMTALEAERLVERDPDSRKYRLGTGLLSVASALLAGLDVRRAAADVLRDLAATTGETSSLMMWTGREAVCVEQEPSPLPVKHTSPIGTTYRTTASSSVVVFLAEMDTAEVDALLADGRVALHGGSREDLDAVLATTREAGVAVNDGLTDPSEVGVSCLVCDHRGEVAGAVLLSAPRFRTDPARCAELVTACRAAAGLVSRNLGGAA